MQEKQQDKHHETQAVSPLVKDKTYGERMYNLVFNQGINFWANLLLSAGFSLYAANYKHEIKLPFMKKAATPSALQNKFIEKIEDSFVIKSMKNADPDTKHRRATAVAEVFTLLVPGHIIMIPSVWLGAKIKPAFVRYFDKKHYGENAEQDPSVLYRHQMIDAEAKPTLLGATVGRLGTMMTTTTASRLIGSQGSSLSKFGEKHNIESLKNFPGLNPVATRIGEVVGGGAVQEISALQKVNNKLSRSFTYSAKQQKDNLHLNGDYNRVIADYSGFVAMDTLYTLVTASVIHPIMAVLRHVPGMTYTTAPKPEVMTTAAGEMKVRVPKNRMAFAPAAAAETVQAEAAPNHADTPKINVSGIQHLDRIRNREQEVSAG